MRGLYSCISSHSNVYVGALIRPTWEIHFVRRICWRNHFSVGSRHLAALWAAVAASLLQPLALTLASMLMMMRPVVHSIAAESLASPSMAVALTALTLVLVAGHRWCRCRCRHHSMPN